MKLGRKISKEELDKIHKQQFDDMLSKPEKPVRAKSRNLKGASKVVMENAIIAKLYKDGFLVFNKKDDSFLVDATRRIEDTYGEGDISEDIREIMVKVVVGLHINGNTVKVNGIVWRDNAEDSESKSVRSEDRVFRNVLGALRGNDVFGNRNKSDDSDKGGPGNGQSE